ncbi:unnamed protein product, partial [Didymodactylos carnosus]
MRDNGYRRPLEDLSNHTRTQRSRSPVDRGTLINEDKEEFSERRNEFEIQETSELDAYQDGSQTQRPSEMIYENENLLDITGTSYGDYARKLMKKLFTEKELKVVFYPRPE